MPIIFGSTQGSSRTSLLGNVLMDFSHMQGGYLRSFPSSYGTSQVPHKSVVMISAKRVKQFYWKKNYVPFGLLGIIVLEHNIQLTSCLVVDFYSQLKMKQSFTSVEHL
ncbi:hypothetical protein CR513_12734, partial [Mucuna pruriens]